MPKDFGMKDIKDGLKFTAKHPVLLPLFLITIADNLFIMGPATVGTPIFVKTELGLGAGAYASTEFCYAIGMMISTALMLAIGHKFRKGRMLLWGIVLDGVTFVPIYFVHSLWQLQLVFIIHSAAIPLLMVPRAALIQEIVPNELTGRIFALVQIAVVGMSALSAAATGYAMQSWGSRWVFAVIGVGGVLCGAAGALFSKQLKERL